MTEIIVGRELLSDGGLGSKTRLHISTVQVVRPAPKIEDGCIVRRLGDEQEYMVDESAEYVADAQTAFVDQKEREMEAKFGRQYTRF